MPIDIVHDREPFVLYTLRRSCALLRGRPKSVASQACQLDRRKISITPFDCPNDKSQLTRPSGATTS
jgi:hypothetical protein